jgi:alanyl-tRNA synthetase
LTEREFTRIEELVNERIRENAPVKVGLHALEDALKQNVMALFGEKYGGTVRMVEVGEYSKELCGGTHAHHTGEIGFFKLLHETGVAAGVRRIEAVTGQGAWHYLRSWQEEIEELESLLKTPRADLISRVRKLLEEEKKLQREVEKLKDQVARSHSRDLLEDVRIIEGIKVLAAPVQGVDPKTLRTFGDTLRERLGTGILVLGAVDGDKALLLVMVSQDLTTRFSAGEIIKHLAPLVGGRGGGRADMAQAGGKFTEKLEEALHEAYAVISGMV